VHQELYLVVLLVVLPVERGNKMDKQARQIDEVLPGAEVKRVGEELN
jgi:hypothetical protein